MFWPGEFHGLHVVRGVENGHTRLSDLHFQGPNSSASRDLQRRWDCSPEASTNGQRKARPESEATAGTAPTKLHAGPPGDTWSPADVDLPAHPPPAGITPAPEQPPRGAPPPSAGLVTGQRQHQLSARGLLIIPCLWRGEPGVWVCVCTHIYVLICVCQCLPVCVYLCVRVCVSACICVCYLWVCVSGRASVCISVYLCISACICVFLCVYLGVCIWPCICVHQCASLHLCVCLCVHTFSERMRAHCRCARPAYVVPENEDTPRPCSRSSNVKVRK